MIITAEEYYELGFSCDDPKLLDSCLKRAEYTLMGLTDGRISSALAAGGAAADYVKQAAGFQTCKLVKQEECIASSNTERVTIGDYTYSSGSESESLPAESSVYDMSMQAIRLLKAAGCLYGAVEVSA